MVSQAAGPVSAQRISSGRIERRKLLQAAFAAAWVEAAGVLALHRSSVKDYLHH
jgi:hypothetical protein